MCQFPDTLDNDDGLALPPLHTALLPILLEVATPRLAYQLFILIRFSWRFGLDMVDPITWQTLNGS
jgi:hypothetical protein